MLRGFVAGITQAMEPFGLIIPAGGRGRRFGGDKLAAVLSGASVLARAIGAFVAADNGWPGTIVIAGISVVDVDGYTGLREVLANCADVRFCAGGDCRGQTVKNALAEVPPEIEWVAIHDAARPLVSVALIHRVLAAAYEHGAAAPALPVTLTIKQASGPLPSAVGRTVPRDGLFAMQTPQIMRRADLAAGIERCFLPLDQVTDDAQLLELAGMPVRLVPGEERNVKITTPLDLALAELILARDSAGVDG